MINNGVESMNKQTANSKELKDRLCIHSFEVNLVSEKRNDATLVRFASKAHISLLVVCKWAQIRSNADWIS